MNGEEASTATLPGSVPGRVGLAPLLVLVVAGVEGAGESGRTRSQTSRVPQLRRSTAAATREEISSGTSRVRARGRSTRSMAPCHCVWSGRTSMSSPANGNSSVVTPSSSASAVRASSRAASMLECCDSRARRSVLSVSTASLALTRCSRTE